MKNSFFMAAAALLLSAAGHAQSTVDSIEAKYTLLPMPGALTIEQIFPAIGTYQLNNTNNNTNSNTTTTDNSMATTNNNFNSNTADLTITLDSSNKGIIWIEGLPQGRIKAYLKQSPATYRILPQKSASGEHVPEGTLVYDSATHVINIELGEPYNEANPTGIFGLNPANANMDVNAANGANMQTDENVTKEKTKVEGNNTVKHKTKTTNGKNKSKVTFYTGTKIIDTNNTTDPNMMQQQPSQTPSDQQQVSPQQQTQPQQSNTQTEPQSQQQSQANPQQQ